MNAHATIAPQRLTRGQQQILELVAAGMTDIEIGRRFGIQRSSVYDTCARIRARIGGRNNAQMVALAFCYGLLDPAQILAARELAAQLGLQTYPRDRCARGAQA